MKSLMIDGFTRVCGKGQGYLGLALRDERVHPTSLDGLAIVAGALRQWEEDRRWSGGGREEDALGVCAALVESAIAELDCLRRGRALRDEVVNCSVNGQGTPQMVTAWEPLPDELARLGAGAPVLVSILGRIPPPMMLEVGAPP